MVQIQAPMWLVEKHNKVPEMLKGFFGNVSDLIQYLRSEKYIREATAEKWDGKIKQAYEYLDKYDIMTALKEVFDVTKGMQLVIDRIKSDAFWKNQPVPDPLRKQLEALAGSLREFLSVLLDMVDYYANTYRSPPIVQASWSEKVNGAYFLLQRGDLDGAIGDIIIIMKDLQPLLDEIRNQLPKIN